jgi:hypothetical protein
VCLETELKVAVPNLECDLHALNDSLVKGLEAAFGKLEKFSAPNPNIDEPPRAQEEAQPRIRKKHVVQVRFIGSFTLTWMLIDIGIQLFTRPLVCFAIIYNLASHLIL